MSVQSETHWQQVTYTKRFQEYAPHYMDGEKLAPLIDLASIDKVPVVMMAGTEDVNCPYATAQETAKILGATADFEVFEGEDHMYFGRATDDYFMGRLISYLQVPEDTTGKDMLLTE